MSAAEAAPPPRWLAWMPAVSLSFVVAGSLWAGGGYISQVRENTRRIEVVEKQVDVLRAIDVRIARIEAKLEVLTPAKEARP